MIRMSLRIGYFFLFCLSLLLSSADRGYSAASPLARQGKIDLSAVQEQLRGASLPLEGEWEFYWQQFLFPADFRQANRPAAVDFLSVPSVWSKVRMRESGEALTSAGFATLRLVLDPGELRGEVLLQLPYVYSACRMWADDRLLFTSGRVAKDVAEEVPGQGVQKARLFLDGKPVELVLHVSNFHFREGGMPSAPQIGAEFFMEKSDRFRQAILWLSTGSLMVMVLYHLCLYWMRRQEVAPLYFSGLCFAWVINSICFDANGWGIRTLLGGDIFPVLLYRIDNMTSPFITAFTYSFFRALFPQEFPLRLQHVSWAVVVVFTLLALILPSLPYTEVYQIYYVGNQVLIVYCIWRLVRAYRNGRDGALLILLGFGAMGLAASNDMLYDMRLIHTIYLMDLGMFLYIMFQVLALASRFSKSFTTVENLSGELQEKNLSLENEIAERVRLEREVVSISEEERRRVSHDLHDGLCQQLTGARLRLSALKRNNPEMQGAQWAKFSSLLETAVSEAYDLSRGLWPVEHGSDGSCPSLEELTRRFSESSGVPIELRQQGSCPVCRHVALLQLYRIAQEAITNAIKHARPDCIRVALVCDGQRQLRLTVSDDGRGRAKSNRATPGGLGMRIMAYRARIIGATLEVSDADGGGTVVACTIPCSEVEGEQAE